MNLSHFDHIVLTVADLAKTCEFYQQVLGMEICDRGQSLKFGEQKIKLHQLGREWKPNALKATPGSASICLMTKTPLEQVIKDLEHKNIEIVAGPMITIGGKGDNLSLYIRDPDGNLLEISNEVVENQVMSISHGELIELSPDLPQSLGEALVKTAKLYPSRGITYLHSDDSVTKQSYAELFQAALQLSNALKQKGLQPQDIVILQLQNNLDLISAVWACILGGFVIINQVVSSNSVLDLSKDTISKFQQVWHTFQQPLILTDKNLEPQFNKLLGKINPSKFSVETIENLRSVEWDGAADWHHSKQDSLAILFITYRHQGKPQGVKLTHANLLCSLAASSQKGIVCDHDISLNWLPLSNPGPLLRFAIGMVYFGCEQIHGTTNKILANPLKWLDLIQDYGVTNTWAPNFAFALINEQAEVIKQKQWNLASVRSWLSIAEPIAPLTARKFVELLQPSGLKETAMQASWGMVPTCSSATISNSYALKTTIEKDSSFADLGLPLPGISLRIVDEDNRPLPERTIGDLQIKGEQITSGYYEGKELNQTVFTEDGWFKTGDLGYLEQGRLKLTGRSKTLIIINGKNYYSYEIEKVIEAIPEVEPASTVAYGIRKSQSETDLLTIFFHPLVSEDVRLAKLIKDINRSVTLQFKINPAYIIPLDRDSIPRNHDGKIDREALKKSFDRGDFNSIQQKVRELMTLVKTTEWIAARNETEKELVEIWRQLFNLEKVSIQDSFFELGGDSLLAVLLFSQINQKFRTNLPLSTIFKAANIQELAQELDFHHTSDFSYLVPIQKEGTKKPFFCIHGGQGEVLCFRNLAYHLGLDQPYYALRAKGQNEADSPLTSIKEMAKLYIKEIKKVQPQGPYLLGGYCFGGLVAFEMAQQLKEKGQEISLLALLDMYVPRSLKPLNLQGKILKHCENLLSVGPNYILEQLKYNYSKYFTRYKKREGNIPYFLSQEFPNYTDEDLAFWDTIYEANTKAKWSYDPQVYSGKITVFRAKLDSKYWFYEPVFQCGWSELSSQKIELYDCSGNHFSFLEEPQVKSLAKQLKSCILLATEQMED